MLTPCPVSNSTVTSTGDARAHTLARHRDILLEFTQARLGAEVHLAELELTLAFVQEFRRLRNNLAASREHAMLLGGACKPPLHRINELV